jgi:hypothetical protein
MLLVLQVAAARARVRGVVVVAPSSITRSLVVAAAAARAAPRRSRRSWDDRDIGKELRRSSCVREERGERGGHL